MRKLFKYKSDYISFDKSRQIKDCFQYSSHYEDFDKAYLHENYLSQKLAAIKYNPYRILDIFLITIYEMEK